MKKNLFGAVSAALALALAITSFGCESGSNDPVGVGVDAAAAAALTFTYEADPTEYTYNGTSVSGATEVDNDVVKYYDNTLGTAGYSKNSYIAGVNAYNILTGKKLAKIEKKNYFQAPALGNVCDTKIQKLVLNAKDNTYTVKEYTTKYAVIGIRLSSDSDNATTRATANYGDSMAYATLPFFFISTSTPASYGTAYAGGVAVGYINRYQSASSTLTEAEAWTSALGLVSTTKFLTGPATGVDLWEVADAYMRGARFCIQGDDARAYYKALNGNMIQAESNDNFVKVVKCTTDGSTDKDSGSYSLSGDYMNGTLTVTKNGSYAFRSDGYYYKDNVLQVNKADVDFTVASTTTTGNKLYSKHRTLSIAGGVVTAPRYITNYTNATLVNNNGFFFDSSFVTYDKAKSSSDMTSGTNAYKDCYSFSIVKND